MSVNLSEAVLIKDGKIYGGNARQTKADGITFDNTGTNLVSENVEDAIVEVNAKTSGLTRMTKLWENPSPTASFAPQPMNLDSADYDLLKCVYSVSTGYSVAQIRDVTVQKGDNFVLQAVSATTSNNVQVASRVCQRSSDTSYSALDAYFQTQGSARATNNDYCIPIAIYGIKII